MLEKGGGWYQICYDALQGVGVIKVGKFGCYVIIEWPLRHSILKQTLVEACYMHGRKTLSSYSFIGTSNIEVQAGCF